MYIEIERKEPIMVKILSTVCGGELSGKDIARDCMGAVCALFIIAVWGLAVVL